MSERSSLTQTRVRELFIYDPDTGDLIRRIDATNAPAGSRLRAKDSKGYYHVSIDGLRHKAHRVIWLYAYGHLPPHQVDHVNGIKSDNRLQNLRLATQFQNSGNRRVSRNNLTGLKGVTQDGERFRARIRIDDQLIHLGWFGSPEDASAAYMTAARQHFGEFARRA